MKFHNSIFMVFLIIFLIIDKYIKTCFSIKNLCFISLIKNFGRFSKIYMQYFIILFIKIFTNFFKSVNCVKKKFQNFIKLIPIFHRFFKNFTISPKFVQNIIRSSKLFQSFVKFQHYSKLYHQINLKFHAFLYLFYC